MIHHIENREPLFDFLERDAREIHATLPGRVNERIVTERPPSNEAVEDSLSDLTLLSS